MSFIRHGEIEANYNQIKRSKFTLRFVAKVMFSDLSPFEPFDRLTHHSSICIVVFTRLLIV